VVPDILHITNIQCTQMLLLLGIFYIIEVIRPHCVVFQSYINTVTIKKLVHIGPIGKGRLEDGRDVHAHPSGPYLR